eukprot:jgi/Bigna1/129981/aug1.10_g4689
MNSDVVRLGKVRKLRKRFTSVLTQLKSTLQQLLHVASNRLHTAKQNFLEAQTDALKRATIVESKRIDLLKNRIQAVDELTDNIKSTSLKNDMLVLLLSRNVQQPYAVCGVMVDLGYVEWLQTIQTEDSRQKLDEFILKTCFLARELDTTRQLTESTTATIKAMQKEQGHSSSSETFDLEKGLGPGAKFDDMKHYNRGGAKKTRTQTELLHSWVQDSIGEVRKTLYFNCESHAEAACALHMNTKDKIKTMKKNLNTASTEKISKTGQSILDMANKAITGSGKNAVALQKLVPRKITSTLNLNAKNGKGKSKINEVRVKMLKNVFIKILTEVKTTLPARDDLEDLLFLTDNYLSDLQQVFDLAGTPATKRTLQPATTTESEDDKIKKLNSLWRNIVKDSTDFFTTLSELESTKNLHQKLFDVAEQMGGLFQRSFATARSAFGGGGNVPGKNRHKGNLKTIKASGSAAASNSQGTSMFRTIYDACMDAMGMLM